MFSTSSSAARIPSAPPASNNELALEAVGLKKSYRSGDAPLLVFADVALRIRRGEMVAIVGESGTGKSTLLHVLSGLDRPSSGDVYFGQRSLGRLNDDELADFRNREIGFVWQSHYLLPEFTALENVMMPLLAGGSGQREAAQRGGETLAEVGLAARASHRAGELSGGEQQRVALARALVNRPAVLMADEPTGNLDEKTAAAVFSLLEGLHRQHGLTSIIVTHNWQFARQCDRILRLHDGGLEAVASALGGREPIT